MKQLISLGVVFIIGLSIGFGEKCCLHKQVGEFSYSHIGSEDTSKFNCISDCVYSREGGNPDNRYCFARGDNIPVCRNDSDNAMLYNAFYSDLSYFHGKLKDLLTPEQAGLVSLPDSCSQSDYKPPNYCWHGKYVNSDDAEYPSGSYVDYRDSIIDILKYLTPGLKKGLSNPCSMARIDCYGECLPELLDDVATCFTEHSLSLLRANCVFDKIEDLEKDCGTCVCQLLNLVLSSSEKKFIKHWSSDLTCEKKKPVISNCDRDCANSSPKKCVFDFTLEVLKTDANGRRADGRLRSVVTYNGQIPGPPIVICEGDELVVNFKNNVSGTMTNADGSTNKTTLHFHGIREKSRPWSDGVPFVTQCPIQPGDPTFHYGFNASDVDGAPPGTYWYHSHVGSQRTNGAYGALIIKGSGKDNSYEDSSNDRLVDVDNASNTLVLQEWYESSLNQTPVSILINGKGRVGAKKLFCEDDEILNYLQGKGGNCQYIPNEDYPASFSTNYTEFHVEKNMSYRFRIIGAISQNFPLQLSIEDHNFTAIAMDSLDIEPVPELTNVWLAAGERYDIVVKTKTSLTKLAYKIKIFGYADINNKKGPLCSIAWLKYPGQTINYTYVTAYDCSDFDQSSTGKTLNPVPNNLAEWDHSPTNGKIFIKDVKAIKNQPTLNLANLSNLNTHYIEFIGDITFNNRRMKYPDVPFLLQNPENLSDRCGSKCDLGFNTTANQLPYLYTNCRELPALPECPANPGSLVEEYCRCQHVIQQPWAPGYWAETVLINNNKDHTAAHPIHQHGGWYWVVGMGKYNHTVNRTWIMDQDYHNMLSRNFTNAPAKDTLQIPQNGYAIIRTPLDNSGAWIFHCHINYHVQIGMAMVLQIGKLGGNPLYGQDWCTGPLEMNTVCKTPPPSPGGGPASIYWYFGMEPAHKCVKPGMNVTWHWENKDHNVNNITKENFDTCTLDNNATDVGDYVWTAPTELSDKTETFYFACGRGAGYHCSHGHMKATINVSNSCP